MTPRPAHLLVVLAVAALEPACGGNYAYRNTMSPAVSGAVYDAPSGESYAAIQENREVAVADAPRSTFAIDVDTASMSNVRRFLEDGQLPPADAVRIEEMINYFEYGYPDPPAGAGPFAVVTEVGPSPFHPGRELLHVGVQGRRIAAADTPPRNLVFLLDTSGSMMSPDKLPLVKQGLALLVDQLGPRDRIGIVAYAGSAGVVLPPTSGAERGEILGALGRLEAGGSTAGAEGIVAAYQLAHEHLDPHGINRVILATDGDFNVGVTDEDELVRLIEREKRGGVALTVLGFGTGNLKDSRMEKLADHGDGNYAYIDGLAEARKVLVEEGGGTLVTIAKDVKVQVELDPAEVASYRLIGYENRILAEQDFRDDDKDGGELGAGHTVTALYEIERTPGAHAGARVATVRLRWQAPTGGDAQELAIEATAPASPPTLIAASDDLRFAAAVAGFGMLLRGSEARGEATWTSMRDLARDASNGDARRMALVGLIEKAAGLAGAPLGEAVVAR